MIDIRFPIESFPHYTACYDELKKFEKAYDRLFEDEFLRLFETTGQSFLVQCLASELKEQINLFRVEMQRFENRFASMEEDLLTDNRS